MISGQQKRKTKERAIAELKRYIAIALYIWVLLSIFEIHRYAVLRDVKMTSLQTYRIGFAAINALIMGKIILIGEALHLGERLRRRRLVYSVLTKSTLFGLLVLCFQVFEEVAAGMIHGKSLVASLPQIAGGGVAGMALFAGMAFVVLIPFFLFSEVQRVIGKEKLHALILEDRAKARAA